MKVSKNPIGRTVQRRTKTNGFEYPYSLSNIQMFSGQSQHVRIGFSLKENRNESDENRSALRESFNEEHQSDARNSTTPTSRVREQSRPNSRGGIRGSRSVGRNRTRAS